MPAGHFFCRSFCGRIFRKLFCLDSCTCCNKPRIIEDPIGRRESVLSKKKSLTPTTAPQEVVVVI